VTEQEKKEIADLIVDTFENTISNHVCRFSGVSDDQIRMVAFHIEEMRELGGGDLGKAMHVARDNHKWVYAVRTKGNKISSTFFWTVVAAISGLVGVGVWKASGIVLKNIITSWGDK
jgi:hypothetical protein